MGVEFHIAENGRDSNPGTKDRPFATLERARDAIREVRRKARRRAGGVTVFLRGGVYPRSTAFELTAEDSGSVGAPVVYRAYPRETVRLLGGQVIGGFKPVTDPAILKRLVPAARGRVVQTELRSQGVTRFGRMRSRGFSRPIKPSHLELFFGGHPMTLARWPNLGEDVKIAGIPGNAGRNDGHGSTIGGLGAGFFYDGDRPRRWQSLDDVWIHGYWAWDWANSYERIKSVDLRRRHIRTAPPYGLYGFRAGQRFHFLNILEELDQPGEWYLDRKAGVLYFWPPKPVGSAEAMVSVLEEPMVSMKNVSNVTLRGLIMECTRGHAVSMAGGSGNRVAGCTIRLTGNYGVWIDGGTNHGVTGCDLYENGDGGVSMSGGDRKTLELGRHVVHNCHFYRQARWSKCYVPAVILSGVGLRVSHNLIHDHPHCPVLFTGNEHRIEFNDIHHVCMETGDVGAIYTGRDWTYRGNVVRHNFIHETGGVGMGSMGVYLDDCVSSIEVSGNVFYRVQRAMFIGGGRDNSVKNNIFVDCTPAVEIDGRGLNKSPVWHDMVYDTMRKRLEGVPRRLYHKRYPKLATIDPYYRKTDGVPPEGNEAFRNVCSGGAWANVHWGAEPAMLKMQDNLVSSDPHFVNAKAMNFQLREDSPAYKLGFRRIPFDRIGLVKDGDRVAMGRDR